MQLPVLSSTVFLTVLLAIGLFFFIRASTKDRIEVAKLVSSQPEESLLEKLQQYFSDRAYRIISVDAEQNQVIFEGLVRPSVFLAIFLSVLAAIGIFCLALVLSFLFPGASRVFPALVLMAPAAGAFYWQKSGRPEQVALRVETLLQEGADPQRLLTVTAHRDELATLRQTLGLLELNEG
ncbi:MAG: cofactor assembly of complex C subunit B [Oculatellaceae cyanobacterium Prado106]|jgi:alkanesulfonate monooxygenase SsuD/methylene tetrahydromethanopterin reductase-like flavin-dependent oxidoreductase (luciferase family)|nr:cofactor assembly of complex C subunit B [Oculatellaceae cyanobacterium Prado106]